MRGFPALAFLLLPLACSSEGGTPLGPTTYAIAGHWVFSERFSDTHVGVSCGDGGPIVVTQTGPRFSAEGTQTGECTGPAGTESFTELPFSVGHGTIEGNQFKFEIEGCPYSGTAYGDAPDSVAGTITCQIQTQAGTLHITGKWVVLPFSDTLAVGWKLGEATPHPSNGIPVGETVVGDLNGDGRQDVAVIGTGGYHDRVLLYYQDQNGGLAPPVPLATTAFASRRIAIGDLNGDGKKDLAISGESTTGAGPLGRVLVYLQSSGTLLPPDEYEVSSNRVMDLSIGDLDGDGDDDLVVEAEWVVATTGRLSIRYQGPAGALGPEDKYDSVVVAGGEVHIADVTGDGRNDIILQSGDLELAVIAQNGNGTLSLTPARYVVQTSYWPNFTAFAIGDLNGDGRKDVVVADIGNSGYLNFFIQNPGGSLTRSLSAAGLAQFFGVEVADVDGDGLDDILGDESGMVGVLYQKPNHTFPTVTPYYFHTNSGGGSPENQALAFDDVTGDGHKDAVVTWSDEGVFVLPSVPVWGPVGLHTTMVRSSFR